jgi:diguanylate cyclase (GGDEF)-like protein/PAS domain S-box-containing protein
VEPSRSGQKVGTVLSHVLKGVVIGPDASDVDEDRRIEPDAIESALHGLLTSGRSTRVTAIGGHGLFVPLPLTVDLHDHPLLEGRSALDLVDATDRQLVIDAWHRGREIGTTHTRVTLRSGADATLYFFDLRERHGVLVGALVTESDLGAPTPPLEFSALPRVSIQRKNDIAVFTDVDEATTLMLGWSREELIGHASLDFVHPDDHDRAIESWMDMLSASGVQRRARLRYRRADGSWMWLELTNQNLLADPDDPCVVTEALDVSEEMAAHEAVRAREHLLRRVAETVPLGLLHLGRDGTVLYANERVNEILGVPKADDASSPFTNVVRADRQVLERSLGQVMIDGADVDLEVAVATRRRGDDRLCTLRLRALNDTDGTVSGAIVCVEDVTERARARAELEHRATYDPLTGCLNRASVLQVVDTHLATPSPVGVIFLDLDDFKLVNDDLGHASGDLVLIEAVQRVRSCVRESDAVGRLGGDEFLVVCPNAHDLDSVMHMAERIAAAFAIPLLLGDELREMRASIGVSRAGSDTTSEALVASADAAMYEAKRKRDGCPVARVHALP